MSKLINEILISISRGFHPLTIVSNPDGFLERPDVYQELQRESKIDIIVGTAIKLRVHFELNLRRNPDKQAIYILSVGEMLPDITTKANNIRFKISDLFPNFVDKETITRQTLDILSNIFEKHIQGVVSAQHLQNIIHEINSKHATETTNDFGYAVINLKKIDNPDWSNVSTIRRLSKLFIEAVERDHYNDIASKIDNLNIDFQSYLDDTYWNSLNANPILKPRCVNGIIPHIRDNYPARKKVALVVVDGMAFWQYEILRATLEKLNILPTSEDWIYSWIPSITSLSRQAIFTGRYPTFDYTQSPNNEQSAWLSHWDVGFSQYFYDNANEELNISQNCRRLAFVTVVLDEKMHSSTSYLDLLALTKIWAKSFAKRISLLKESGFTIILTTDHGNMLANGWRTFTKTEKAHLYGKASRGKRHAFFLNHEACNQFKSDIGYSIRYLQKDMWYAIRDNHSFNSHGRMEVTHGGSHLFEVMIPFIKY